MQKLLLLKLTGLITAFCVSGTLCADGPTRSYHTTEIDGFTFQVRDGYKLSKVAGAELVTRPTVCDWDDQGRLVTVSSAGAKGKVEEQLESTPHSVVRLVDENGDGVFDRRIVAAKDLSFYSGVLCVGDDIFVSAPPSIWKLKDADGDGVCESREVWHDGGTITYCANDLHGPYMGPDGWIYWCKGAFGEQAHHLTDGTSLISKASHILRKRPEGGPVEIVTSGGMDNPIELAFLNNGERFFTSTFLQHPSGGRRDGIAHAVHGGVFGKRHNVIDGLPRTGDLMPVMTHLGPAAPTGLVRRRYGNRDENVLVCGQFNLHCVSQHRLVPTGATYETVNENLLTCDRLDFHPTDVIEDEDGSLVFLDTGDWYDLCCPSSGAEGQRSPGGVYRLREVNAAKNIGNRIDWASMTIESAIELLNDPRFRVRDQAAEFLVDHASDAMDAIASILGNAQGVDRVASRIAWVLARIDSDSSQGLFESLLDKRRSPDVQHAALMAAVHCDSLDSTIVHDLLIESPDAGVQRAAAQWLGLHGGQQSVSALMNTVDSFDWNDRVLRHSLLYALIQLNRPSAVMPYLSPDASKRQHYAALLVLDQIASKSLRAEDVIRLFSDSGLPGGVAADVLKHHEDWATALSPTLIALWTSQGKDAPARAKIPSVLRAWRKSAETNELLLAILDRPDGFQEGLALVSSIPIQTIPRGWDEKLARRFKRADSQDKNAMAEWLAQAELTLSDHPQLTETMIQTARQPGIKIQDRLRFAAVVPSGVAAEDHGLSGWLKDALLNRDDSHSQSLAARVASELPLEEDAAHVLLEHLGIATTATLPGIVEAIVASGPSAAEHLLDQLPELSVAKTLQKEFLVGVFDRHESLKSRAAEIADQLSQPSVEVAEALAQLQASLPDGDMVRGMRVFHGQKAACAKCHLIGDVGGVVGPELSRIGRSRTRLELLEAIVFPSSHIAQGYRSVRVLIEDGQVYNGVVKRETADELQLVTGIDREVTIDKSEIVRRQLSDVSIMPAGLDGSLSKQELADVVELLKVRTSR